jgi:predicted nucleotidyltransferase component of viral defense system
MIPRAELNELAQEWGLTEQVVEKDYVLGWVLWGIGEDSDLRTAWAFKGGTCLKKCYIETYRFSEDLDFTVLPDALLALEQVQSTLERLLERVGEASGIEFGSRPPRVKQHGQWPAVEARIYYQGPRQTRNVESVKLDLLGSETVVRPTVLRPIAHPYSDQTPAGGTVRCYSFEEVFAEKLRALGERCRPRDLYDVVNLYWRRDLRTAPSLIRDVLADKCTAKGIPVPTLTALERSPARAEVEEEWANMLGHQLPLLPPFAHFWDELAALFAWLEGGEPVSELAPIPSLEAMDEKWQPPPTIWSWGTGQPFEAIRFAGANHLCVEINYNGSWREVEPYSLRRTQQGHILLHAIRTDNREHRTYRIDRVKGVRVTTHPFRPIYLVEFAQTGPIDTLPSPPRTTRSNTLGGPLRMVVECPVCGRQFTRTGSSLELRPHKQPNGWACSGRQGISRGYAGLPQFARLKRLGEE